MYGRQKISGHIIQRIGSRLRFLISELYDKPFFDVVKRRKKTVDQLRAIDKISANLCLVYNISYQNYLKGIQASNIIGFG